MAHLLPQGLISALLFISVLFVVGCGKEDGAIAPSVEQVNEEFRPGERHQLNAISSNYTGVSYPLKVYLPHNYDAGKQFPVIYVLDAEWRFETVADSIDKNRLEVILVGVENYVDEQYKHREDYSQWPLAKDYFDFLTQELAPVIESTYSTDATNRTIMGHSLTGLFVGLALLIDDHHSPFFHHHVSFDGSFWAHRDITPQLINDRLSVHPVLKSRMILVAATASPGNARYVNWFEQLLTTAGFSQLELYRYEYEKAHIPVVAESIDDVIMTLYLR